MRKLDIQIDIAREKEDMDKEKFHQDLRHVLEQYFELNSIHIRKEVHTVEVERLPLKPQAEEEPEEWRDVIEIEREPLVTEFDSAGEKKTAPATPSHRPRKKTSYY
ncbi:hypothetical protein C8P63_12331 [Melghirimyces profundicolus]|uniref:Uncharacterized protein n=1 Tax=Melghirimyces profundicolus TaxID=1242148 RepID=A0A2T6BG25_9BACL|nr:hypothetical protein [Melghirimyces profundicolus]PTX55009.1 hypothetical protein C8P63_12331 [Melghirimyces profundicolus]